MDLKSIASTGTLLKKLEQKHVTSPHGSTVTVNLLLIMPRSSNVMGWSGACCQPLSIITIGIRNRLSMRMNFGNSRTKSKRSKVNSQLSGYGSQASIQQIAIDEGDERRGFDVLETEEEIRKKGMRGKTDAKVTNICIDIPLVEELCCKPR